MQLAERSVTKQGSQSRLHHAHNNNNNNNVPEGDCYRLLQNLCVYVTVLPTRVCERLAPKWMFFQITRIVFTHIQSRLIPRSYCILFILFPAKFWLHKRLCSGWHFFNYTKIFVEQYIPTYRLDKAGKPYWCGNIVCTALLLFRQFAWLFVSQGVHWLTWLQLMLSDSVQIEDSV